MVLSCSQATEQVKFNPGVAVNTGNSECIIPLDSIGIHYTSLDEVIREIETSTFDSSFALNAWDHLCRHTFHEMPITTHKSLSKPELLINSVSFGHCDDVAQLMARLCVNYGLPARLVYLGGHTVVEVKEHGKWMVLDVDQRNYLLAHDGRPASYQEILEGAVVKQVRHPVALTPLNLADLIKNDSVNLTYSLGYYQSEHNNSVGKGMSIQPFDIADDIILPANSKLEFTHLNNVQPVRSFVKVVLYPEANGRLYLPLVPMGTTHPLNLSASFKQVDNNLHLFTYDVILPDTFEVSNSTTDTVVMYYLANGLHLNNNRVKTALTDDDMLVRLWCKEYTQFGYLESIADTFTPENLSYLSACRDFLGTSNCITSDEELFEAYAAFMTQYNTDVNDPEPFAAKMNQVVAYVKMEMGDDIYSEDCNGQFVLNMFIFATYFV